MEDLVLRLLPIFSNLFFILPAKRALRYGHGDRAALFFIIVVASSLYHLCIGFARACLWSVYKHHVVDFGTAELVIPVTALYFVKFRAPMIERWLIWISVIAVFLLVTGTESTFMAQVAIAAIAFSFVFVYVIWHRCVHGYWPEYELVQLTLGVAFTILAVAFFVEQNSWPPGYGYIHSFWHAFGAIGQYFLLGIRPPVDPMLNLAAPLGYTPENPSLYTIITTPQWERDAYVSLPIGAGPPVLVDRKAKSSHSRRRDGEEEDDDGYGFIFGPISRRRKRRNI